MTKDGVVARQRTSEPGLYDAAQPTQRGTEPGQVNAKEDDILELYNILDIVTASDLRKYQMLTLNDAISQPTGKSPGNRRQRSHH